VARLVDEVVADYRDRSITAPLQPLLDDPEIERTWTIPQALTSLTVRRTTTPRS